MRYPNDNRAVVLTGFAAIVAVGLYISLWLGLLALAAFVVKVVVT